MKTYAKSLVGALTAFLGSLAVGAAEGGISAAEWIIAAGAGVAALGVVYQVPNEQVPPTE